MTKKAKAVGLISGGLDSALATYVVKNLGIDVHGVYFSMPWGCCDKTKAIELAQSLEIPFIVLQLDERYLEIVKKPKFGYGTAMNPCVDCRIHMFSRAKKYMDSIGADFVFTGEVLGQRPMSQMKRSMGIIEKETGLEGRLLRPLCAQLLAPTIPETEGLIDRAKLLQLSGRSRKTQIEMAERFGIKDYLPPAGGCLLTDQNFARRMKDTFNHGYRNFNETISLKWGRHFRFSPQFKIIVGRDASENEALHRHAHGEDYILELDDKKGPTVVVKGENPSAEILGIAAGLLQRFSKHHLMPAIKVSFWRANQENDMQNISATLLTDEQIEAMKI